MRRRTQGFTSFELIVGMLIFIMILSAVFSVTMSTSVLYRVQQSRLGVNRNARSSYDLLGNDVRQAGERLTADFPAIAVAQDANGNSVLSLRRSLADTAMPLCAPLSVGNTVAYINANNIYRGTVAPGVSNLPDACTTDLQDTNSFAAQISAGNTAGYIYDTRSGLGSWITISAVNTDAGTKVQTLTISGLSSNYDPRKTSVTDTGRDIRLYLLEERRYSVGSNALMMTLNNGTANIATPNVQKFLVQPYLEGNPPTASSYPFPNGVVNGHTATWRDAAFLDLNLTLSETHGGKTVQRTVSERYNPRNALSGQ